MLLLGHGLGIISLPCLCSWMFTLCFACCLYIQLRSSDFTVILGMGSGPTNGVCAPICLHFHCPSIPEWLRLPSPAYLTKFISIFSNYI
ncbi:hypothetical protein C0J52_00595 [Blattella germanica]|nr:hypothetical protein C0J52_00595 [Blattella germanica]